jgi:TfoX/Sxy family transcriptional regulator of competence genes
MAYDENLATRIRTLLEGRDGIGEKKMFGGIAFLLNGNMACGVNGPDMIVRLAPEETDAALAEPGVRLFDMSGRPMKGWIMVAAEATAKAKDLRRWVDRGTAYAASLPPK